MQHQLVGADAFVRLGVHQQLDDLQVLLAHRLRKIGAGEPCARLVERDDAKARRKHPRMVLVALQEARALEPRDRRLDAGVGVGALRRDRHVGVVVGKDLARRDHDLRLARAPGLSAQESQDFDDVLRGKARARRQSELDLDVLLVVEQDALRVALVAARAAGFLQVVLDGAGDLGMDHEPHVGLVDTHAERVRRGDHAQVPADERLLHRFLHLGRQARVEMAAGPAVRAQKRGDRLGALAARGEHDGAAVAPGELVDEDLLDQHQLVLLADGNDLVVQVRPLVTAGEAPQLDAEDVVKVAFQVRDDVELRGRGEARDLRQIVAVALVNEARRIQVIGAKVVAPLRQAMRLVEDPGGDVAIANRLAKPGIAQLLGRDEQDADVAEPDAVEHVLALGHREQAV